MLKCHYTSDEEFQKDLKKDFFEFMVIKNVFPIVKKWREEHGEVPKSAFVFVDAFGDIVGWGETLESINVNEEQDVYAYGLNEEGDSIVYKSHYFPHQAVNWECIL